MTAETNVEVKLVEPVAIRSKNSRMEEDAANC